uniref:26S proteasome non-ATPase regulatory subunit 5 n=1 Tax=Gongylonema pulchrum TaxID=637853 RepID=A0A183EDC3_9BILA
LIQPVNRFFFITSICSIKFFIAFLKFFGHLTIANAECLSRFPKFLDSLLDSIYHFDRLDASLRLNVFDTFGAVGSSAAAKKFLDRKSELFRIEQVMNSFGVAIASGPIDLRVRHIDALAMLLRFRDGEDHETEAIANKWYKWLGDPFSSMIVAYLIRPFPDLRMASLRLVLELIGYKWAVGTLCRTSNFLDNVMKREIETTAEGRQCRYDIVCKLIDNGETIIPPEDMIKLKLFRREGAFFVERKPMIDMEND